MAARHRADALTAIKNLAPADYAKLQQGALDGTVTWGIKDPTLAALVSTFREEVKDYYFTAQRRKCCYCSFELQSHKLTYDAEHILDKDGYPQYAFEPSNIAAVCKHCNIAKSNKPVSALNTPFTTLSKLSADYSIVHPHLDEWTDHLRFDEIGRIRPAGASSKGQETIRICGIEGINAARLSDEFSLSDQKLAEKTLRSFHEEQDSAHKQELLELLEELAVRHGQTSSKAVVSHLAKDLGAPVALLGFGAGGNLMLPP